MKIVYMVIEDPIAWKKPETTFFDDEKKLFVLNVVRVAGIAIHEDKNTITIAEVSEAEDNKVLADEGVIFPRYRYVMTVAKKNIIKRQDFIIKDDKQ